VGRENVFAELLSKYCVDCASNLRYTILRTIPIDRHEVAWTEIRSKRDAESPEDSPVRRLKPMLYHQLMCECDVTEGVGYRLTESGILNLEAARHCMYKEAAVKLRILELRSELGRAIFGESSLPNSWRFTDEHFAFAVDFLMAKAKDGQFLAEVTLGAEFWGGCFYLQTLAEILQWPTGSIWHPVHQLIGERKIMIDGMIVRPYRSPNLEGSISHAASLSSP
jgi:hypothetical protein